METATRNVASAAKPTALTGLGQRLRTAQENTQLTQQAVAERLNVTAQTVRNWEAGRHESTQEATNTLASLYCIQPEQLRADAPAPDAGYLQKSPHQRIKVDHPILAQARRDAGLSQAKASERVGISLACMRRYESGAARTTRATLRRLALIVRTTTLLLGPRLPERDRTHRTAHMDDTLRTYLEVQPDLSSSSVSAIADFILFTHHLQMSRNREQIACA